MLIGRITVDTEVQIATHFQNDTQKIKNGPYKS
jgi:hypothetical protein